MINSIFFCSSAALLQEQNSGNAITAHTVAHIQFLSPCWQNIRCLILYVFKNSSGQELCKSDKLERPIERVCVCLFASVVVTGCSGMPGWLKREMSSAAGAGICYSGVQGHIPTPAEQTRQRSECMTNRPLACTYIWMPLSVDYFKLYCVSADGALYSVHRADCARVGGFLEKQ